ncbi:MAG: mandelate racemase/muconate lactonizing enzyme family protein [Deltaproteobacteria bacterium]|nr:mandelate racemase/muconate lactonizing enzyme family protein [Deltaproteobacteria bacterium]
MKIVDIQERTASIASRIRNAYIDFSRMTVSVAAVFTDVIRDGRPVVGYGFNSNGRYAQGSLLRERFIPRVREADPSTYVTEAQENLDPFRLRDIMMANEKPGGHGERSVAVGVIDMAVWDAVAKIERKPLYRLLADRYNNGGAASRVFVYAAGGYYYPGKGTRELRDEMSRYLDAGYRVVKIKIGGAPLADDLGRIEEVLSLVGGGDRLAVDANGRFNLDAALEYGDALRPYGLRWYEEPGDPLDYQLNADLVARYQGAIATGENLFSMQDMRNLLRHGGLRKDRDVLQMDPVLSYGLVEYLRMLEVLAEMGWSRNRCIPHGGHQFALNIAAGLGLGGNESYPEVFAPFGGFADDTPVEDGMITLPEIPGIGFEAKSDLMDLIRSLFGP